jgi:hypothetical protein
MLTSVFHHKSAAVALVEFLPFPLLALLFESPRTCKYSQRSVQGVPCCIIRVDVQLNLLPSQCSDSKKQGQRVTQDLEDTQTYLISIL